MRPEQHTRRNAKADNSTFGAVRRTVAAEGQAPWTSLNDAPRD